MTEPKESGTNNGVAVAASNAITQDYPGSSEAENVPRWNFAVLFSPASTTISAGLYLFDFVSNILVLKEYYDYYKDGKYLGYTDTGPRTFSSKPFTMCLALMVMGHVGTVIAFKLKLPREQNPIRSAYFLPLLQFRRFVKGLIKTGSCARHSLPPEPLDLQAEALYSMVSAAIETGPQVALQFLVIVVVSRRVHSRTIPPTLLLSLIASFASGSYNTGRAVMFAMSSRWTVMLNDVGILAGIYTGGALLLRMLTIASVMNYWMGYFQPGFYGYLPCWLFPGSYAIGLICVSPGKKLCSWSGQLHAIVAGYVNFTLGPLYPVIDGYRGGQEQFRSCKGGMSHRLGLTLGLNLLLDVIPLCISAIIRQNPCDYHLDSGEKITATLTCRNYLAYIITGTSLTLVMMVALIHLLHTGEKPEAATTSDETLTGSGALAPDFHPRLSAEDENPEAPFYRLSRRIDLDKTEVRMETVSSHQPSTPNV